MEYRTIAHTHLDSLMLEILIGDIARLPFRVGALVSFDDVHLAARSTVARSIRSRANSMEVDKEIAALAGFPHSPRILPLGDVNTTAAGNAHAERIVHAVVFDARGHVHADTLAATIDRALQKAEEEGLSSVAIPVLDAMEFASCHGIRQFAEREPTHLRAVLLVARTDAEAKARCIVEADGAHVDKKNNEYISAAQIGPRHVTIGSTCNHVFRRSVHECTHVDVKSAQQSVPFDSCNTRTLEACVSRQSSDRVRGVGFVPKRWCKRGFSAMERFADAYARCVRIV